MRFDREPWVKLYKAESPAHRLMSLEARCLRDFLLRHADERGLLLERSDNVPRDLCRVISADSSDAKKVVKWLKELEVIGYAVVGQNGRVVLPRFEEAQKARSPGAKRQAEYEARERAKREADGRENVRTDSEESVSPDAESDVTPDVTRDEMRNDEMRRDPPKPPEGDDGGTSNTHLIPCPRNLVLPAHVTEELMSLFSVSSDDVLAEVKEFKSYWTIGGGMGRTFSRGMWLRKCRERVRQRLSDACSGKTQQFSKQIQQADGPGPADPAIVERNRRALEAWERQRKAQLDAEVAS